MTSCPVVVVAEVVAIFSHSGCLTQLIDFRHVFVQVCLPQFQTVRLGINRPWPYIPSSVRHKLSSLISLMAFVEAKHHGYLRKLCAALAPVRLQNPPQSLRRTSKHDFAPLRKTCVLLLLLFLK